MSTGQANPIYCVPGDRLIKTDEKLTTGSGTYSSGGYVYASVAGAVQIRHEDDYKVVEVVGESTNKVKFPTVGSVVTCKVMSITQNYAKCAIYCIDDFILKQPFRGIIRKEDVRATEKDKVEIHKSFRPGDVVLAKVYGSGENHSFLLTTAENELGVVIAQSEEGVVMVPTSWTEMTCPKTFAKEQRKIAKIVSETFTQENQNSDE